MDPRPTILSLNIAMIFYCNHHKTKLVNCLLDGHVPKTAMVTKKASLQADDLKNDCPVPGLRFPSKLVERMVDKQLLEHIHVHDLDNKCQSANKIGHSTETAFLSIKMKFTHFCQENNLQPWYCLIYLQSV